MSDDAEATQHASTQAESEGAQAAPAEAAAALEGAEATPAQAETQPSPAARAPAKPASARRGRARSVAVGLFFFLTCLSLILATTTWWLHDTVLETDHFVALTAT